MKKISKILLLVATLLTITSTKIKTTKNNYCDIYGVIYFEKNRYAAQASIFIEEDETRANLLVFKEDNKLFADQEGLWYITENPSIAHYRLYKTNERRDADITIAFIEERAFVGCQ